MTMYLFRCCGLIAEVDNSTVPTVTLPHLCNQGIPQIGIADAQNLAVPADQTVADTVAETNVASETVTQEAPE
jgi:hypothetical protein